MRHQARPRPALDNGSVVAVCRDHAAGRLLGRRLDHAEQALLLGLAVDDPAGVEYLVATVLRVRLGKHHELGIGRITTECTVAGHEVVDFLVGQRQPEVRVGHDERVASLALQWNRAHGDRPVRGEQGFDLPGIDEHGFGHAIEQEPAQRHHVDSVDLAGEPQAVANAPFDPLNRVDVAGRNDIRRLG